MIYNPKIPVVALNNNLLLIKQAIKLIDNNFVAILCLDYDKWITYCFLLLSFFRQVILASQTLENHNEPRVHKYFECLHNYQNTRPVKYMGKMA